MIRTYKDGLMAYGVAYKNMLTHEGRCKKTGALIEGAPVTESPIETPLVHSLSDGGVPGWYPMAHTWSRSGNRADFCLMEMERRNAGKGSGAATMKANKNAK